MFTIKQGCDQSFQFVATLHKKLENFDFTFFNFYYFLFSKIFSISIARPWLSNEAKFIIFKIMSKKLWWPEILIQWTKYHTLCFLIRNINFYRWKSPCFFNSVVKKIRKLTLEHKPLINRAFAISKTIFLKHVVSNSSKLLEIIEEI